MDRQLLRQLRLYRPYPDAVPWAMFEAAGLSDAEVGTLEGWIGDALAEPPRMHLRVARFDEDTIAAYLLEQAGGHVFTLRFLLVDPVWRGRGVGYWAVGHALGLAESKGGQALRVSDCPATNRFFQRYGFQRSEAGVLNYPFVPE